MFSHYKILIISFFITSALYAQEKVNLTIVHSNDTHSCVQPLNPSLPDTNYADKGGYIRRKALVEELRQQDPDLLLFDGGDFSQGSAYYNLYKGEVEVKLMNMMKYDAATIGNHEFDFGLDNMARIFKMADFPIVCCNYDFSATVLKDIVKPYIIMERKGIKIGVLAVCAQLEGLVSEKNSGATKFLSPVECANKIADKLRNEDKCDLVICLSHLGWNVEGVPFEDEGFIKATHNIDMVIGAHSHSYFTEPKYVKNSDGIDVMCNQMGKNGQFIGVLNVEMDKK